MFPHMMVKDVASIQYGSCRLNFMQTPGHTIESVCIALTDLAEPSRPRAVFTGDTLFGGDVGRPDLSGDRSPQELAAMLYQTPHEKLLRVRGETEFFRAHAGGCLRGAQMGPPAQSPFGKRPTAEYGRQ